jgi:eukaryotic-like serine/threonine-protein kinase
VSPTVTQVGAGSRIAGRYLVVNHCGGGSDGDVYDVVDEHLGNEVALKLLAPKAGQPATWDEAQILEQIRSEYLLPVLNADVVPGGDLRYITTTLMTGGDLEDAALPRGVSPEQAVRWGQQLGHGLDRVHAANLVHRDVKPANGFLNSGRVALLGDLGMAAVMEPDGSAPPYGTFATVAPEVLGIDGRCSIRSDVYSLGATVFYLATGEYPVSHNQTRAAMAAQIVAGQRRKLRDLSPHVSLSLGRVVERALSTDPASRQPNALTLANQLSGSQHYRRTWKRIAEHPGHQMCFRGDATRTAQAVDVCVIRTSNRQVTVDVQNSGGQHLRRHERSAVSVNQVLTVLRGLLREI